MDISVVGAGRVGTALAVLLSRAGHRVAAVSGREGTAERAARYYRQLGISDRFQFNAHPGGHEFHTEAVLGFFAKHL